MCCVVCPIIIYSVTCSRSIKEINRKKGGYDFVLRSDAKLQFLQYAQGQFLVTWG